MSYKIALAHLRMLGYSTINAYSHVIFVHKPNRGGGMRYVKETQHWSDIHFEESKLADVLNELQQGLCPFKDARLSKESVKHTGRAVGSKRKKPILF